MKDQERLQAVAVILFDAPGGLGQPRQRESLRRK
jgi:hypothetical protein